MIRFDVKDDGISMNVATQKQFEMSVEDAVKVGAFGETYEGSYEITPTVARQVLPTKEKYMNDDLTVKAIPVYNVSNTSGGSTFYIATMDEDPDGALAILGKMKLGTSVL